jgi:hypothetical protein
MGHISTFVDQPVGAVKSAVVNATRTAAAGSGVQSIAAPGGPYTTAIVLAVKDAGALASWGLMDDASAEGALRLDAAQALFPIATVVDISDAGGNPRMSATAVRTSTGMDLTWTKTGVGIDVELRILFVG